MPLVTLKRFFKTPEEEEFAHWRLVWLLLQAISLHTVEADKNDFENFRAEIGRLQSAAGEDAQPKELLAVASSAAQVLGDYSQRATDFFQQRASIHGNIISMLTQTIVAMGSGTQESADRLCEIQAKLSRAVVIEDVHNLKFELDSCLKDLQEEATRQKERAKEQASQIEKQLQQAKEQISTVDSPWPIDSNTGLPGDKAATAAFQETLKDPERKFVVVAVVNRIQSMNARFGREVGDQVLRAVAEFFQSKLLPSDQLYRWRGPALVALVERGYTIESVRADINRISRGQIERVFTIGGKRVMVPLSASWLVMPVGPDLDSVTKKIDKFVASLDPGSVTPV